MISEALAAAGFIETMEHYIEVIKHAWEGKEQHVELLIAVYDYKTWVTGSVWETEHKKDELVNSLKHLNTARYFRLRKRGDGAVCLWYKPDPMHKFEYPTKKDQYGEPETTTSINGEKAWPLPNLASPDPPKYLTCDAGLNHAHRRCM